MVDNVNFPGVERRAHVSVGTPRYPPIYHTLHENSVPQHARLLRYLQYDERQELKYLNVRACTVRSALAHAITHVLRLVYALRSRGYRIEYLRLLLLMCSHCGVEVAELSTNKHQ